MKTRPEIGEIEPEVLSASGIEEVRRHPASYSEKNLVATIDNFRWRLDEEQKTIRLLEDVAVKHGYDKEGGEDLAGWLDEQIAEAKRAIAERSSLREQVDHWHKKYQEKIFANE